MFQVYQKLKDLRKELRPLNRRVFSDITSKVNNAKSLLEKLQSNLIKDPFNEHLHEEERAVSIHLFKLMSREESILRQKSRANWIKLGDLNSKFFHKSLLQRQARKKINIIKDEIIRHFEAFIGTRSNNWNHVDSLLLMEGIVLDDSDRAELAKEVSPKEVKAVIFSINEDKTPGPDGYTSAFSRKPEVLMLRQANSAVITLIPKVNCPESIGDYGPIACVICIVDNILLANKVVRNYHRGKGNSCAIKVDIQKAYNFLEWDFIEEVLIGGEGLRQGDHVSPLLFVLCMEYFSRLMKRNTKAGSGFSLHKSCKSINLNHLCFVDGMFIFSNGDSKSIQIVKDSLITFSKVSSLSPNHQKSTILFNGVSLHVKNEILRIIGFQEGCFPVKYLGLPLITTRLTKDHCESLIQRITSRVNSWSSKSLSYVGRLQLINSVLLSMQVYWC
ncbi:uncharacterized protein LOC126672629 [Mercurialis annua]|uniref:uncharacterized protein LOC126672629 n=1 Tax=Mercurialis annua TaxID=3986 RepID=UPI00215E0660|nr:uncharacterized protein LOC126672629 [Mercurialis annua]